jgi:hypothetical protein
MRVTLRGVHMSSKSLWSSRPLEIGSTARRSTNFGEEGTVADESGVGRVFEPGFGLIFRACCKSVFGRVDGGVDLFVYALLVFLNWALVVAANGNLLLTS